MNRRAEAMIFMKRVKRTNAYLDEEGETCRRMKIIA
jgi:hypothetical protein